MNARAAHTPGPWAWFGNANSNSLYLATTHSGRRYVMDFTRWGLRGAQPRFQPERGGMIDAKDLLQFEVGDRSIVGVNAAKKDTSVYRYDVRGIDSADARLIAAAPDMLEAGTFAKAALLALESYEADYGERLHDDYELGHIEDSRNSSSFRIRVGHIRRLAAAIAKATIPQVAS